MPPTVILTFDDSDLEHYAIALPLLERYGFQAVFGVVTSRPFAGWDCVRKASAAGHLLVSHSHAHPRPLRVQNKADALPERRRAWAEAAEDLRRSVSLLRRHGCPSDGFLYPHDHRGLWRPQLLRQCHIRWALRGKPDYRGTKLRPPAIDPYDIPRSEGFRLATEGRRKRDHEVDFRGVLARFRQLLDGAADAGQVAILTFHAIGRDGGWDNIPTDIFEHMLDHLRRNQCRTTTDVATFLLPPELG